jgi:hypothetical protein
MNFENRCLTSASGATLIREPPRRTARFILVHDSEHVDLPWLDSIEHPEGAGPQSIIRRRLLRCRLIRDRVSRPGAKVRCRSIVSRIATTSALAGRRGLAPILSSSEWNTVPQRPMRAERRDSTPRSHYVAGAGAVGAGPPRPPGAPQQGVAMLGDAGGGTRPAKIAFGAPTGISSAIRAVSTVVLPLPAATTQQMASAGLTMASCCHGSGGCWRV